MVMQPDWIRRAIAVGNQFHYRKRNLVLHNALNLSVLTLLLLVMFGVASASMIVPLILYIPAAAVLFGLLYFALITLVNHEGCHGMFIVMKNRDTAQFWNRVFGWSLSLFFAMHFREDWEKGHHHEHHLRPIENDGVIYHHLLAGKDLLKRCAKIFFIPGYLFVFEKQLPQEHKLVRRGRLGFIKPVTALLWLILGTVTTLAFGWVVPVAMFLGIHVVSVLQQIKLTLEHGGKIGQDQNRYFRSRTSLFPLRQLVMPLNISMHFEHHLNYCVPWYDLPRYHRALRDVIPEHVQRHVFNRDVWPQLTGRKDVEISNILVLNRVSKEQAPAETLLPPVTTRLDSPDTAARGAHGSG